MTLTNDTDILKESLRAGLESVQELGLDSDEMMELSNRTGTFADMAGDDKEFLALSYAAGIVAILLTLNTLQTQPNSE